MPVVFSGLMTLGVVTFFRACNIGEGGMWMNCHYAQMEVFYTGLVLTALSVAAIFIKNPRIRLIIRIAGIIAAVTAVVIPGNITGLCMMENMRCHTLMRPFVTVFGIFAAVSTALDIVISRQKTGKENMA